MAGSNRAFRPFGHMSSLIGEADVPRWYSNAAHASVSSGDHVVAIPSKYPGQHDDRSSRCGRADKGGDGSLVQSSERGVRRIDRALNPATPLTAVRHPPSSPGWRRCMALMAAHPFPHHIVVVDKLSNDDSLAQLTPATLTSRSFTIGKTRPYGPRC